MGNKETVPFTATNYGAEELAIISEALSSQRLEGGGTFSKKVQDFFGERFGFPLSLFTPSCTDALEASAILCELGPDDEVIVPSFTFPTSAHAFYLRGAKLVLADSSPRHPNMDLRALQNAVSEKTKAVCLVHYGGVGVETTEIADFCRKHGLLLIEDAAQAIDAYYAGKPLGSFGDAAAFSFHQTKNISCGEGGLLVVNRESWRKRAEIIREKGTNRQAFLRGEVDKYTCVDMGSSFVGSDLNAALLLAQLQKMAELHARRKHNWQKYWEAFSNMGGYELPDIPEKAQHNAHNFYIVLPTETKRDEFLNYMKEKSIQATFHFVALHLSPFYSGRAVRRTSLGNAEKWSCRLVRLPLFNHMSERLVAYVIDAAYEFSKHHL